MDINEEDASKHNPSYPYIEIKNHNLKDTDPGELLEKLQTVYASKSLTNKLCLRWEVYQIMKD